MSQQTITISIEDKAKLFEFNKLFKSNPQSVTPEMRTFSISVVDKAWTMVKDQSLSIEVRNGFYDIIKAGHEILARKFDDSWRPREGKKQFTKRVITIEERQANCDSFVKYIGSRNLEDPIITVEQLARIWSGSY
jgi:hypothetical protein